MKDALIGAWVMSACYSWVVRSAFEVDVTSPWNWAPILAFTALMIIGAGHEENESAKKVTS